MIFLRHIEILTNSAFVTMDASGQFRASEYGEILAKMYLRFETAKLFVGAKREAKEKDILEALCRAEDFSDIRFHNDKGQLNLINKNPGIRYPIKGKVSAIEQKISLCLQAVIGGVSLGEGKNRAHTLHQDAAVILQQAQRISRGMVAIFLAKRDPISMVNAIRLGRAIQTKLWNDSNLVLRQVDGLGPQLCKLLLNGGIQSFSDLKQMEAHKIELITNRHPPFGSKVLESVQAMPELAMCVKQLNSNEIDKMDWDIEWELTNMGKCITRYKGQSVNLLLVCGTSDGDLVDLRKYPIYKVQSKERFMIQTKFIPPNEKLVVHLICQEIVGIDISVELQPKIQEKISRYFVSSAPSNRLADEENYWDALDEVNLEDLVEIEPPISDLKAPGSESEIGNTAGEVKSGYVPCNHFCLDKQLYAMLI
jgi:ATP-dependent DNA helicase HFM1/MER3